MGSPLRSTNRYRRPGGAAPGLEAICPGGHRPRAEENSRNASGEGRLQVITTALAARRGRRVARSQYQGDCLTSGSLTTPSRLDTSGAIVPGVATVPEPQAALACLVISHNIAPSRALCFGLVLFFTALT